ncbi:MAG: glycosyltransferase [Thermoleophilia bacterium]
MHALCLGFRLAAGLLGRRRPRSAAPPPHGVPPSFTVLAPLFREPGRAPALVAALAALDHPRDRLEVMVLVEHDDHDTAVAAGDAVRRLGDPPWMRVEVVPPGLPRTKPRALMHGLGLARGTLLAVFYAEDVPDARQLRDAAAVFATRPPEVACLQALPVPVPSGGDVQGRVMAAEYGFWHGAVLPGLARLGAPVPLAGTSNHLRVAALRAVGGWDPWNVTEDADLGVRLAAAGFRTEMLASTTREESTPDGVRRWVRQRSRWSRGFLVTSAAAARRSRALGLRRAACAQLVLAGTVAVQVTTLLLAVAPVTGPVLRRPWGWTGAERIAAAAFAAGIAGRVAVLTPRPPFRVAAAMPVYAVLEGVAALHGLAVLARDPSRWDTTDHPVRPVPPGSDTPGPAL